MRKALLIPVLYLLVSCASDEVISTGESNNNSGSSSNDGNANGYTLSSEVSNRFDIDFDNLPNYANQSRPNYITKDNQPLGSSITCLLYTSDAADD